MKAFIRSVGSYVPERVVSNDELAKTLDTSDEWIYTHTGIHKRHVAAPNEAASDLGYRAAMAALDACRNDGGVPVAASDIDLILVATSTPDYPGFPSTACLIQNMLGAKKAGAMDLSAACTGFIYALESARSFIVSGFARHVLVVGTEVFSRIVDWKDRATCVLFGDGAGAALVSRADEDGSSEILNGTLRSDGAGAEFLLRPAGGSRTPFVPGVNSETDQYLQMNGRQVYVFAVGAIIETINTMLASNGLAFTDLDLVVPHQANRRIIEASCKRESWDEQKFHMNMDEYANTSAASIPIALDEIHRAGKLKRGMRIMTLGFGAGLTYGGNFLIW